MAETNQTTDVEVKETTTEGTAKSASDQPQENQEQDALLNDGVEVEEGKGDAAAGQDPIVEETPKVNTEVELDETALLEKLAQKRGITTEQLTASLDKSIAEANEAEKPKLEAKEWVDLTKGLIESGEVTKQDIVEYETYKEPDGKDLAFAEYKANFKPQDQDEWDGLSEADRDEIINDSFAFDLNLDSEKPFEIEARDNYFKSLVEKHKTDKIGKIETAKQKYIADQKAAVMASEHNSLFRSLIETPRNIEVEIEGEKIKVEIDAKDLDWAEYRKTLTDKEAQYFFDSFNENKDLGKKEMALHIENFITQKKAQVERTEIAKKAYEIAKDKFSRGTTAPFTTKEPIAERSAGESDFFKLLRERQNS